MKRITQCSILVLCFFYPISLVLKLSFADYDLFARIAVGRLIERDGAVPLTDVFSFSTTKAIWYDHEWLAGVLYYWIVKYFSGSGLLCGSIAAACLTFYFLYRAQQRYTEAPSLGMLVLSLVAVSSCGMWAAVIRAQAGSFLFFAISAFLLAEYRQIKKRLALAFLPILFIIWINFHGGFVVGLGLIGCTLLAHFWENRAIRSCLDLFAALICCCLAVAVNPYGFGYFNFIAAAVHKERLLIDEWKPLPLNPLEALSLGHGVFYFFLGMYLFGLLRCARKIPLEGILFTSFALLYGISHLRLLPFFYCSVGIYFLAPVVLLLKQIGEMPYCVSRRELLRNIAALSAILAAVLSSGALLQEIQKNPTLELRTHIYPETAFRWLRSNYPGGKILTNFNSGSFALWRGYPQFLVAVDGRYEEVYEDDVVLRVQRALSRVYSERDAELSLIDPDFVIRCGDERNRALPRIWLEVFADSHCDIFSRTLPGEFTAAGDSRSVWVPNF